MRRLSWLIAPLAVLLTLTCPTPADLREPRGGADMAWTSLEEEEALLASLTDSGRVAVDVVGHSVQGRPIRLVRVGSPPPEVTDRAGLLIVGLQHGHEPAGREAALRLVKDLAVTADPTMTAFLEDHGVLVMPTMNPDGFAAGQRENASGRDLNRDHIELTEPETRALAMVMQQSRPLLVLDLHETDRTYTADADVAFMGSGHVQTHPDIVAEAADLITAFKARGTTDGFSTADYQGTGNRENRLWDTAGLRHSVGVLVETLGFGSLALPEEVRTTIQYAILDEAVRYAAARYDDLLTQADQAAADKAAEGAAGVAPFDLRTEVLDPPPLAYRIAGVVPQFHLQAFGIQVQGPGVVVSMAQPAQPLIPFLFDPLSEVHVTPGQRLFSIPTPVVIATPQDFAPV